MNCTLTSLYSCRYLNFLLFNYLSILRSMLNKQAASSALKFVLGQVNGLPPSYSMSRVHDVAMNKYVRPFASYSNQEKKVDIWNNSFKFMFVRHPLERLVSAHRNKFQEIREIRRTDHSQSVLVTIILTVYFVVHTIK